MLKGVLSSNSGGSYIFSDDDKHHAKFDLTKLIFMLSSRERDLLVLLAVEGVQKAVARLKTHKDWVNWRIENRSALEIGRVTYSSKIFSVLDDWEQILIDNDYIGDMYA